MSLPILDQPSETPPTVPGLDPAGSRCVLDKGTLSGVRKRGELALPSTLGNTMGFQMGNVLGRSLRLGVAESCWDQSSWIQVPCLNPLGEPDLVTEPVLLRLLWFQILRTVGGVHSLGKPFVRCVWWEVYSLWPKEPRPKSWPISNPGGGSWPGHLLPCFGQAEDNGSCFVQGVLGCTAVLLW